MPHSLRSALYITSTASLLSLTFTAASGCGAASTSADVEAADTWQTKDELTSQASTPATPEKVAEAQPKPDAAPANAAPVEPPDTRPRIGALGPHTWVYKRAEFIQPALGKLRMGTSVPLKSTKPVPGKGCPGGWYEIEPRGFVCNDTTATLDLDDPYYLALKFAGPAEGRWPYRYAHSDESPMYSRVPTPAEWEKVESKYPPKGFKPLGQWAIGHEELITDEPIKATDPVPYFLKDNKRTAPSGNYNKAALVWRRMPRGSMLAYSHSFEQHGRVWLLTPDLMVVPADRYSQMRRSTFEGVYFDKSDMELPFAWNRAKKPIPLYQRDDDGRFSATDELIPAKTPKEIVDEPVKRDEVLYYPLRDRPDRFMAMPIKGLQRMDGPVTVTRQRSTLPRTIGPDAKWIEVRIIPGTLTAYEGLKPVLATMFSPGKGGPPVPGNDHEKYATTATGFFPIEWKERVATMSNENGVPKLMWFTDVPNQQYLRAPLAMHTAFWHEDYGHRKSAECVNVSPIDGEFLFGWTEPGLPEGWNAVRPGDGFGKSTPVIVTVN